MKTLFIFALVSFSAVSFAQRGNNIDCSRSEEGVVTLTYKTVNRSMDQAIASAYGCLSQKNTAIKAANSKVLKAAKVDEPIAQCKLDKINTLILTSWIGERISIYGEKGGEAVYLVQQPVTCGAVGTGLFGGVLKNNLFVMEVTDDSHFTSGLNPKLQTITVTFRKSIAPSAIEKL